MEDRGKSLARLACDWCRVRGAGRRMLCGTGFPSPNTSHRSSPCSSWGGFLDPDTGRGDRRRGCGGSSLCGRLLCAHHLGLCLGAALMDQREGRGQGGGAESGPCSSLPSQGKQSRSSLYLHSPDQCKAVAQEPQGGPSPVSMSHSG